MTKEHYPLEVIARSRRLYDQIRPWVWGRDDVTIIGGWAVYEMVYEDYAQQSRDIDLVMHTSHALYDFDRRLSRWGLTWRTKGRNTFNDCYLLDDPGKEIVVDVMLAVGIQQSLLKGPRMRGAPIYKTLPRVTPLPDLHWLVKEKLDTVPRRVRDADDKRIKDFVDIHNLVFYNARDYTPRELRQMIKVPEKIFPYFHEARARVEEHHAGA